METIIPKQFKLGGLTIDVIVDNEMFKKKTVLGEARYATQEIAIDTTQQKTEAIEHNFCHELIHWLFYICGEQEHRQNEKMVDLLACFLHQMMKTDSKRYQEAELKPEVTP